MAYRCTPETRRKMLQAVKDTDGLRSRAIRCPRCGHRGFDAFEDATGHLKAKCAHCKAEVIFNLVSMRRVCRPMFSNSLDHPTN